MESKKASYGAGDIENLKATELRLGLPGTDDEPVRVSIVPYISKGSKRTLVDPQTNLNSKSTTDVAPPAPKAQVVGWPPIRSYRRNSMQQQQVKKVEEVVDQSPAASGLYVKVSMDGAPYLRKIDLNIYKGYRELRDALECMFKSISDDHAVTYEDKDGDWMLAGDVPWEMFACSCKRLRIMKGSEAKGLSLSSGR